MSSIRERTRPLTWHLLAMGVAIASCTMSSLWLPSEVAAQAQATTGVITGIVSDPTGVPIVGASVTIRQQETGFETTVETVSDGRFARPLLQPGTYDVSVRADGQLGIAGVEAVRLRLGETVDLAIAFQVVELAELTVIGEGTPLVDTRDATRSHRLSDEVVSSLPSDGRNYLTHALLAPGASISQGPDGDVLNINGQRGIFNNISVDGADFNNPFFGEQRGGQRPAFTFNQDAIEEMVVVGEGAPAEFGRSAGGFVNLITKSGTNELQGSAHYFGQWDGISGGYPASRGAQKPEFGQHQFGFTLGGPIARDKAFFFLAYDQQEGTETKQQTRNVVNSGELAKLQDFLNTTWPGLFENEFGPIERTNDNRALLAKLDFNLSDRHQASVKYNYTWSEQLNGTFDVDSWGLSNNGQERAFSHALNASFRSQLSNSVSNEFRFQIAREDRPRGYQGPLLPNSPAPPQPAFQDIGGRPFPDIAMDFADGFRIGMPYFLPIDPGYDTRFQLVNNLTLLAGDHLFKAGVEFNHTAVNQQFIGLANGLYKFASVDGFMNFVTHGNGYVTCSDGSDSITGTCPVGTSITGPVLLYLQSTALGNTPQADLGKQEANQKELGLFLQDTWTPSDKLTINMGLRWEGSWHPDVFIQPEDTYYAPWLSDPSFPTTGIIPDDLNNFQPRFGLAWDPGGNGRTRVRLNAGSYFARLPMLVFAQHRTSNGAYQGTLAAGSELTFLPPPPNIGDFLTPPGPGETLAFPGLQVPSRNLEVPRTWAFGAGLDQQLGDGFAASVSFRHSRADNLFRFVDRNAGDLGSPYSGAPAPIGQLTVMESNARSRYSAVTTGLRGQDLLSGVLNFEANYTLSFDKSDDDNERDPFNYYYASATNLTPEYNWSLRDRRHQLNGYFLFDFGGSTYLNSSFRYLSASPMSESCGPTESNPFAPPAGGRAGTAADRICADGSILTRNTLRRDNDIFMVDLRLSKEFQLGNGQSIEPVLEVFNLTNADNYLDTAQFGLLFNFDGTIRSGLGDPRRAQLGVRYRF